VQPFSELNAVAVPILRDNIDTDIIIPSREMKSVAKTGLAAGLFAGWRYREIGGRDPNPDFVLNQDAYAGAAILLGGANFGCGSSREHAVWALAEYGIRAIIAPSFAPIFFGNCVRNGIVPVRLPAAQIAALAAWVAASPASNRVIVNLLDNCVSITDGRRWAFELGSEQREMLLEGLDAIDLTWKWRDQIEAFEADDRRARPWIYLPANEPAKP
jgi:3-isopropylmalate/(R)-2-methylmalate dehydratase small subunit